MSRRILRRYYAQERKKRRALFFIMSAWYRCPRLCNLFPQGFIHGDRR